LAIAAKEGTRRALDPLTLAVASLRCAARALGFTGTAIARALARAAKKSAISGVFPSAIAGARLRANTIASRRARLAFTLAKTIGTKVRTTGAAFPLIIDELGYLRYDAHLADLLYEVISRRYDAEASTVIATNNPFSEWNQVFEGAARVATMVDRLCHRVELVQIDAASYRATEAAASANERRAKRTSSK